MSSLAHAFCHRCGDEYPDVAVWPRVCERCGNRTWRNPTPVPVLIVPVVDGRRTGLMLIDRALSPQGYALPGGFLELGEQWEEGAARELLEETSLIVDPVDVETYAIHSTSTGESVLLFGLLRRPLTWDEVRSRFAPADGETSGYTVSFSPEDPAVRSIVFPHHRLIAQRFLRDQASAESH